MLARAFCRGPICAAREPVLGLTILQLRTRGAAVDDEPAVVIFDLDIEEPNETASGKIVARKGCSGQGDTLAGSRRLQEKPSIVENRPMRRLWHVEAGGQKPRPPFLTRIAQQGGLEQLPWGFEPRSRQKFAAAYGKEEALHQGGRVKPMPPSQSIADRQVDAVASKAASEALGWIAMSTSGWPD
jgi:hypothetical protein